MTEEMEYIEPAPEGHYEAVLANVDVRESKYQKMETITIEFRVPSIEGYVSTYLVVAPEAIIWWAPLLRGYCAKETILCQERFKNIGEVVSILEEFIDKEIILNIDIKYQFIQEKEFYKTATILPHDFDTTKPQAG